MRQEQTPLSPRTSQFKDCGTTSEVLMKAVAVLCVAFALSITAVAADTLVMRDGTAHTGTFVSATTTTITFREGRVLHRYPRSRVQSLQLGDSSPVGTTSSRTNLGSTNAAPARRSVEVPAGTEI